MSTVAVLPEIPAAETLTPVPLDQVELTIEIGQTTLSLSEVAQLRPGAIVALREFLNDPVTIFAGAKLVGRGELQLIEGQLGVRITELYRSQVGD